MPVVQVWNSLSFPSKDVFVPFIPFLFKSPLLFSPVHLPTFIPILSLSLSLSILSPLFSNNFSLYLKHLVSATPSFHPFVLFFSHTTCVCVCVCVCARASLLSISPVQTLESNVFLSRFCFWDYFQPSRSPTNSRQRGKTSGFSIQMAAICSRW